MNAKPRPVAALLGFAAGILAAWGLYHLMLIGSCSTPAGPGEVECPPEAIQYFFAVFFGIIGSVLSTIAGGSWASFYGLFAGIGVAGVLAGTSGGGPRWFIAFGLCFLLTPLLGLLALPFAGMKRLKAARLLSGGVPAVGTVLAVDDTGVTINNNPRLRMRFRIEPGNGLPPFDATKTATVPRIAIPRVGDRFPVWLDPNNPNDWMFASGDLSAAAVAAAPAPGAPAPTSLRQLVDLAKHGARPTVPPPPAGSDVVGELGRLNELRLAGAISAEEFAGRTDALLRAR